MPKNKTKELETKIKEILQTFKYDKNILIAGYVGSVAKGHADEYSDLDIVIFTKTAPNYKSIRKTINTLSSNIEEFKEGNKINYHFDYKGTIATIGFKQLNELKKQIKQINSKFDLEDYKKQYSFFDYKVIFGDRELVKKLKNQIPKKIPNKVIKNEFENLYKWVVNNIRKRGRLDFEIKRQNWISVNYRFNRTLTWFIQLLYLINGIPFQEVRWIHEDIRKMKIKPKNCINKLNKIVKLGSKDNQAIQKVNLLRELVSDLDKTVRKKGFNSPKLQLPLLKNNSKLIKY